MEALLNYMYKGEVNVPQEMLPELIKAAEAFRIKGLAVPDDGASPKTSRKRPSVATESSLDQEPKKSRGHDGKTSISRLNDKSANSLWDENVNSCKEFADQLINTNAADTMNQPNISTDRNDHDSIIEPPCEIKAEPLEARYETLSEDRDSSIKEEQEFVGNESNIEAFDYASNNENLNEESGSWNSTQPLESDEVNENDPSINRTGSLFLSERSATTNIHRKRKKKVLNCRYAGCSFTSLWPALVKIHLMTHTGEKPFKCPHCPFRSARKGNVDCHVRLIHYKQTTFNCLLCGFKTSRKLLFKTHLAVEHQSRSNIDSSSLN